MDRRIQIKAAEKKVPRRLWDFLAEHQSKLMTFIPRRASGRTGHELVTGQTPDMSEYLDFDSYDLVWYLVDKHPSTGLQNRQLDRTSESKMTSMLRTSMMTLTKKGIPSRTMVTHVSTSTPMIMIHLMGTKRILPQTVNVSSLAREIMFHNVR